MAYTCDLPHIPSFLACHSASGPTSGYSAWASFSFSCWLVRAGLGNWNSSKTFNGLLYQAVYLYCDLMQYEAFTPLTDIAPHHLQTDASIKILIAISWVSFNVKVTPACCLLPCFSIPLKQSKEPNSYKNKRWKELLFLYVYLWCVFGHNCRPHL